ncbi:8-amino-7-oxononanoate synthase [Nibrella saemangeumensis]|uniref:8-amino-7-oxononanoate synthase n=1 Tax=Nibrella saemangeumensis TaxID=1084526 RepID=A0ABP8MJ55_9BACT
MAAILTTDHLPGRTILHNNREYLFFSGTSYLGIPQNTEFQQLLIESLSRYGTMFGSSRNGNLRLSIYEEAERQIAALTGAEAALTLSSGMMAGQVVANYLRAQQYSFLYGPCTHPALWHEPTVDLPTLSFVDWTDRLPDLLTITGHAVIAVNSIDAVRSEAYPFDWVNQLPTDQPITLVVDDSHGLGVLREAGSGIWQQIPRRPNVRLIVTASLAKAMGLPGGVVFSDAETIAAIQHTAFFGACSPIPPAYLDAFRKAETIYTQARIRLTQNIALAERLLLPTGLFRQAAGYPVFYTEWDELYPFLLENGIFIYSFAYPTPADKANTRIVISAFHEPEDINRLAACIYELR